MRVATAMQTLRSPWRRSVFRRVPIRAALFGAVLLGASTAASAHHSVVAAFDMSRHLSVAGTVTKVVLGSPHSEIFIETLDPAGNARQWRLELLAASKLRQLGWTQDTLPVGDRVHAEGAPSRYEERVIYTQLLQRSDGTRLPLSLVP